MSGLVPCRGIYIVLGENKHSSTLLQMEILPWTGRLSTYTMHLDVAYSWTHPSSDTNRYPRVSKYLKTPLI